MHISGEIVNKFMGVVSSAANNDAELHLSFGKSSVPIRATDNSILTLGDLRELIRPFTVWMED